MPQRVLVLFGGPSGERDVSLKTGQMVIDSLDRTKYEVRLAVIDTTMRWSFDEEDAVLSTAEALARIMHDKISVVFIALHGAFGEDGQLQMLLDQAGIRYTGSGAAASALAMSKLRSNEVFQREGFSVPPYVVARPGDAVPVVDLPVVVKPVSGGSSVATSIVRELPQFQPALDRVFAVGDDAMIQQCIEGTEVTCGVLEDGGVPVALPPTEIVPTNTFFDYEAKYQGKSEEITPARLNVDETRALQDLAVLAHRVLGCRSYSRSDFILANGTFFILETNTLPGLTSASLLPQEAATAGISFSQLLDRLIANVPV